MGTEPQTVRSGTGGMPYFSVPEWVRTARAYAKEHFEGDTLKRELDQIWADWEASESAD